ncbi:MAG: hypothetical protein IPH00_01440 [Flavobacteriales bacterium]|nr:hypothetical protein [Flavobacteriales bacterium]
MRANSPHGSVARQDGQQGPEQHRDKAFCIEPVVRCGFKMMVVLMCGSMPMAMANAAEEILAHAHAEKMTEQDHNGAATAKIDNMAHDRPVRTPNAG